MTSAKAAQLNAIFAIRHTHTHIHPHRVTHTRTHSLTHRYPCAGYERSSVLFLSHWFLFFFKIASLFCNLTRAEKMIIIQQTHIHTHSHTLNRSNSKRCRRTQRKTKQNVEYS